jgi:transcriptional regulator with XRE-family HTH domain
MDILVDISLGMKQKEIAEKHGVSASYVSKVKRGKKIMDVPIKPLESGIELDTLEYVTHQINLKERELEVLKHILNIIKEANYAGR